MPRRLGWLCLVLGAMLLTQTQSVSAATSMATAMQAAATARGVPLAVVEATAYVNTRWEWVATPQIDGGMGPMKVLPSQVALASSLSGHTQGKITGDAGANLDAGAALMAYAHTSGTDLASWQASVAATQGPVVAVEIFAVIRTGATRTTSTGEMITLAPQSTSATSGGASSVAAPDAGVSSGAAVVSSPDYPSASWVPASSANFTVADRGHDYPIDMIVIHDIEGSAGSAIQAFQNPSRAASAHYVVGYDGSITQMVLEKDIAWHAGNWDYNTRAIGIEHAGYAYGTNLYTTAEYNASAQLIASICSRWGVPMDRAHVIGHYQVPDPYNPGLYGGYSHHTDPGPNWNWTYYMQQAAAAAAPLPSPPHLMPDPIAVVNANGTSATITWTPARTCHTPIASYTVTGQPGNLSMNLPATATSATFNNLQSGVDYTFSVTATNADGQDTQTAQWRCGLGTVSATPGSPQLSGTSVTFNATSTGCPHPQYQFWILPPGGTSADWQVKRSYSPTASYTWNTSGLVAGNYLYSVWVEDTTSFGANCSFLGCNDAYLAARTYTLTSQPCKTVTDTPSPPSGSQTGTTVTFTATSTGCPNPQYQFWILPPGSTTWQIKQAYSSSNTYTWSTNGLVPGNYLYTAWARDTSSTGTQCSSLGCDDAYVPAPTYQLAPARCTSVTESASPGSPQLSGTTVTFTATSTGCPRPLYQFWVLRPGSKTWQILQPYSTANTYTWNTSGLAPGTYLYTVWARDTASPGASCSSLGCDDAYFPAAAYNLTRQPCASVTEAASPASPQQSGTSITFTASALGCPHPLYQFWILRPGSTTWQVVQAYSPSNTFVWNTGGLPAGSYLYTVWARDASSSGTSCGSLGCDDAYFPGTHYTLS